MCDRLFQGGSIVNETTKVCI